MWQLITHVYLEDGPVRGGDPRRKDRPVCSRGSNPSSAWLYRPCPLSFYRTNLQTKDILTGRKHPNKERITQTMVCNVVGHNLGSIF